MFNTFIEWFGDIPKTIPVIQRMVPNTSMLSKHNRVSIQPPCQVDANNTQSDSSQPMVDTMQVQESHGFSTNPSSYDAPLDVVMPHSPIPTEPIVEHSPGSSSGCDLSIDTLITPTNTLEDRVHGGNGSTHCMITRSQVGSLKPESRYTSTDFLSSADILPSEPKTIKSAMKHPRWLSAMKEELAALHKNRTVFNAQDPFYECYQLSGFIRPNFRVMAP